MAEIHARSLRFAEVMGIIRQIITGVIVLGCVYLIFAGIEPIMHREPGAIQAFASVVHEFFLSHIICALVSTGTTSA